MDLETAKQAVGQGGVTPAMLYVLLAFVFSVVAYVLRDYVANHKNMILALQANTEALASSARERARLRKLLRKYLPQQLPRKQFGTSSAMARDAPKKTVNIEGP